MKNNQIDKALAGLSKKKMKGHKQIQMQKEVFNRYYRNKKNDKRLLWTITHQQIGQPRGNGHIPFIHVLYASM